MGIVDITDEQFIHAERKNQHESGKQITVYHFHYVRDSLVMQQFSRVLCQGRVCVMQHMANQIDYIYSGHVEDGCSGSHTGYHCYHNDKASTPEGFLKQSFYVIQHVDY